MKTNKQEKNNKKRKGVTWFRAHRSLGISLITIGSVLAVGGGTVGALFAAGVIPTADKTSISTIFDDSTYWQNDVAPITGGTGAGYVANTSTPSAAWPSIDNASVISFLKEDTSWQQTHNIDVLNDIKTDADDIAPTVGWVTIDVTALSQSRNYDGDFKFYVYIQTQGQGTLANDFTNTAIDLSAFSNLYNVNDVQLFGYLKTSNANLNINAITFQYNSTPTSTATWVDWSWESKFGIGTGANQTNSLLCWSITNDRFEQIRITPGGVNPNYYAGQSAIAFTLKLYRDEITSQTGWKNSWNNKFVVTPTSNSFLTRFDTLYSNYDGHTGATWFTGKLDGAYAETYDFPAAGIDTANAIFTISGNPFYKTQSSTSSSVNAAYKFGWVTDTPVDVATVIIKGGVRIENLNNIFYQTPNQFDVITVLKDQIDDAVVNQISWSQISITISTTNITLKGVTDSLIYSQTVDTITYTLKA